MKKLLTAFAMGMGIGQCFYIACLYLFGGGAQPPQTILMVALISGLMGVSGLLYELPKLPIWTKTVLHFCLIAGLVAAVNLVIGHRFFSSMGALLGMLLSFSLLYFVIWTLMYLVEKRKIAQINAKLK